MRVFLKPWFLAPVFLAVCATAWAQDKPGSPAITFEESAVAASGLTPGKSVVWFGVELRVDAEYTTSRTERYHVGTVAADGTARFTLDKPVALRSIWTAVDLDSGAFALAVPQGYRLVQLKNPPCRLGQGAASQSDAILDTRPYLVGLVVRPGTGAWSFAGGDGGQRDEDGVNDGHLRFALDKLDPLQDSPARSHRVGTAFLIR